MVEIVSGQTPFQAESTQGVYEKVSLCQPQYNKFVSQNLRDLLSKIFVPDPELRISLEAMKEHSVFKVSSIWFPYCVVGFRLRMSDA